MSQQLNELCVLHATINLAWYTIQSWYLQSKQVYASQCSECLHSNYLPLSIKFGNLE